VYKSTRENIVTGMVCNECVAVESFELYVVFFRLRHILQLEFQGILGKGSMTLILK